MYHWTVHLEGGPRRVNHAAVVIRNFIYSFGGYCTGENFEVVRPIDVHILNTDTYKWSFLLPPFEDDSLSTPFHRYGHTAVAHDEKVYLFGGRNDKNGACNVFFCFDPRTRRWSIPEISGKKPGARDGHSACVIKNKMYMFGGFEEWAQTFSQDIFTMDFLTMEWSLVKPKGGEPARWRDFHSSTGIGDLLLIFGGRSDRSGPHHTDSEMYCHRLKIFDTNTSLWYDPQPTGGMPSGRRSHSAFVYNNDLYIFGGYNGLYEVHFDDLYRYSIAENKWHLVLPHGVGPSARRRQCGCIVGGRLFIFGGTRPCNQGDNDVEQSLIDLNDLFVLDFNPTLRTLCMLAVIKHKLNVSTLPQCLKLDILAMTTHSSITRPMTMSG